jgi:hypothetical protein
VVGFATTTWCGWYTGCSSGKVLYRVGSPFTDIASLVILADGESDSRFTNANYAWIVFGVLFWILIRDGI